MLAVIAILPAFHYSAHAGAVFSGKAFTYYAESQSLGAVLTSFARAQGLGASVSPAVSGVMSGKFDAISPQKFLEGVHSAFGVAWYRVGSSLYFYHETELGRIFISPRVMTASELVVTLRQSPAFSSQLPLTLNAEGNMITVSGPHAYLAQISAAAKAVEEAKSERIAMRVFPLKYAWAEDVTVNSMDKTVTIPGIASILQAMVTGAPASPTKVVQQPATVDKLMGTGLVARGKEEPAPAAQGGETQSDSGLSISIMADPRVNAVLVHDAEYRMPYYAKVIEDLDKPVELVEIHAAIVDISTDSKRDLGVTYQSSYQPRWGWGANSELSAAAGQFPPYPVMGETSGVGLALSTIYTNGSEYFLAKVQALEKMGEARMLGRPSVLTVDNVQATLENTSTYYLQIGGFQAVDLFKVEAGTFLRVTPHIIRAEDGTTSVRLAVSVQDDQNDGGGASLGSADAAGALPPIKQTKINTQAIVGSGQSLLIGGYYYEQKTTTESGIPVLMNLPLVGNVFKTSNKGSKRMERLILITPKVVKLGELPAPPEHVDAPSFHRSPTQDNYTPRAAVTSPSGCTRRNLVTEELSNGEGWYTDDEEWHTEELSSGEEWQ